MSRHSVLVTSAAAALLSLSSRAFAQPDREQDLVRRAVLDYVEGFYEGDSTKHMRSVRPEVFKLGYYVPRDSSGYRAARMTWPEFHSYTRRVRANKSFAPADAPKDIQVFEVHDQIASARVRASWGIDFLLLGKYDGRWMITHVLWQTPTRSVGRTAAQDSALASIRANYDALARAFARADTAAILGLRSPDFFVVFPNGARHDAAQMRGVLRHFFVQNRPPYASNNTIQCAAFPAADVAVITIFQQASRMQEVAGRWRRVDSDITQRETWRRLPEGWRLASVDSIRAPHRWVDGKQIDPSRPFSDSAPPFTPPAVESSDCSAAAAR